MSESSKERNAPEGAKPRTPTDFTICRDCFQAWPTENLQDGNDKPCDCGDGTGTYFFHVLDRESVLDLLERAHGQLDGDWFQINQEWGTDLGAKPEPDEAVSEVAALLREHGRLK